MSRKDVVFEYSFDEGDSNHHRVAVYMPELNTLFGQINRQCVMEELHVELRRWIHKNIEGKWHILPSIYNWVMYGKFYCFENEEDAVFFKMVWG